RRALLHRRVAGLCHAEAARRTRDDPQGEGWACRARSHQRHRGLLELRQELALHVPWRAPAILPPVPGRSLLPVQSSAREPATLAVQASQADLDPGTTSNSGPERLGITFFFPRSLRRRVAGQVLGDHLERALQGPTSLLHQAPGDTAHAPAPLIVR